MILIFPSLTAKCASIDSQISSALYFQPQSNIVNIILFDNFLKMDELDKIFFI